MGNFTIMPIAIPAKIHVWVAVSSVGVSSIRSVMRKLAAPDADFSARIETSITKEPVTAYARYFTTAARRFSPP